MILGAFNKKLDNNSSSKACDFTLEITPLLHSSAITSNCKYIKLLKWTNLADKAFYNISERWEKKMDR